MLLPVFAIGQGDVYLTPQSSGMATMTFCHGGQYTKLRNVDVGVCYSELVYCRIFYPANSWLYLGQSTYRVFLQTKSLSVAIDRLKDREVRQRVHQAVSQFFGIQLCPAIQQEGPSAVAPASLDRIFPVSCPDLERELVHWTGEGYKITTAMCPSQHPVVVASKRLYQSGSKIHKRIVVLYSPDPTDASLVGKTFVLTKVPPKVREEGLRHEVQVSRALAFNQVPNVVALTPVIRGSGMHPEGKCKHGALCEYFEGGNLRQYISSHFNSITHSLLPMYQQVHLTLALQIAKTLSRINLLDLVHGDMRLENILVRLTEKGPEAVLGDFGLTEDVGSFTARALGFFPPPETQPKRRQPQDMRADTRHDESQPSQAEQAPCGSKIDLNVDGWALGIVFFTLFHGFSFDVDRLSFTHDRETILRNREELIALLAPEGADVVDDLIRRLLDIVPTRRSLSFHAVQALERIISLDK